MTIKELLEESGLSAAFEGTSVCIWDIDPDGEQADEIVMKATIEDLLAALLTHHGIDVDRDLK